MTLAGEARPPGALELERVAQLVLDGLSSPESRRAYRAALTWQPPATRPRAVPGFLPWAAAAPGRPLLKATVQAYRAELLERHVAGELSAVSVNLRLCAVRKLAGEAADNGLLAPELAAGIERVPGVASKGERSGNWLTLDQAQRLLELPDVRTLKGRRDRALLAVLLGCGLRRRELAALRFEDVAQRAGRWAIVDLRGKGGRVRTVPMPPWAKALIDAWAAAAGLEGGRIFRRVRKGGRVAGEALSPQAVFSTVKRYARALGLELAPHDLRRTFAKLAHGGRTPPEQIQLSLGHASMVTTERYLGVRQDLADAPCDRLGLRLPLEDLDAAARLGK